MSGKPIPDPMWTQVNGQVGRFNAIVVNHLKAIAPDRRFRMVQSSIDPRRFAVIADPNGDYRVSTMGTMANRGMMNRTSMKFKNARFPVELSEMGAIITLPDDATMTDELGGRVFAKKKSPGRALITERHDNTGKALLDRLSLDEPHHGEPEVSDEGIYTAEDPVHLHEKEDDDDDDFGW